MPPIPAALAYDAVASTYDQHYQRPIDLAENAVIFSRLRRFLPPTGMILDIGCGTALLLEYLNIPPSRYVGIDVSKAMLVQARSKFPAHTFLLGDMDALPAAWTSHFAAVLNLFGGLSYSRSPASALSGIERVLQPGGRFFLMPCAPRYLQRPSYILNCSADDSPMLPLSYGHLHQLFHEAAPSLQVSGCGFHYYPEDHFPLAPQRFLYLWLWMEMQTWGHLHPEGAYFYLFTGQKTIPSSSGVALS